MLFFPGVKDFFRDFFWNTFRSSSKNLSRNSSRDFQQTLLRFRPDIPSQIVYAIGQGIHLGFFFKKSNETTSNNVYRNCCSNFPRHYSSISSREFFSNSSTDSSSFFSRPSKDLYKKSSKFYLKVFEEIRHGIPQGGFFRFLPVLCFNNFSYKDSFKNLFTIFLQE